MRDSDSDEEWADGGYASDGGASVGAWDDGEVEVSPEDERAMAAFMVRNCDWIMLKWICFEADLDVPSMGA